MKTTIYTCQHCGKQFDDSPSAKRKFCSRKCYASNRPSGEKAANWRGGDTKYVCEVCGDPFSAAKSDQRKFCSRKCFHTYLNQRLTKRTGSSNPMWKERPPKFCEYCGEPFETQRYMTQQFCSMSCMGFARMGINNRMWRGGSERRGAHAVKYKNWRNAVFERDGYACQQCGSHDDLHAHHKKLWATNPELRFVVSNGLTLCRLCHYTTPH